MRNVSSIANKDLRHLSRCRRGFTLIELMVVITIMLILFAMTVYGINFTRDADKVRGAAAQVQSFLSGARDRAIYAKEARGVRFFVDPGNPRSVSAMAYIQPGQKWSYGTVDLERLDINPRNNVPDIDLNGFSHVVVVRGERLGWWQLKRRGLLTDGSRIRMPRDTGNWYEVDTSLINITALPTGADFLLLRIPYSDAGGDKNAVVAHTGMTYELELPSQLLAQEPSLLPEGAVIDLDGSKIPNVWRPRLADEAGQFSPYMDIFFSPRGNVIGNATGTGIIHFYVCDAEDSLNLNTQYLASLPSDDPTWTNGTNDGNEPNTGSPLDSFEVELRGRPFVPADEIFGAWLEGTSAAEPYLVKDRRLVSIFAQTGAITVGSVDVTDGNADGFADSPFALAQSGKGAK
jgi:prepilin-type N-terminal cleavage/methylation domain-containing protein